MTALSMFHSLAIACILLDYVHSFIPGGTVSLQCRESVSHASASRCPLPSSRTTLLDASSSTAIQEEATSSSSSPSQDYDKDAWLACYKSCKEQGHYEISALEGTIPTDLQGTVYSVGAAGFDVNGQLMGNPFVGDGMATAVTLNEGRAHFRNSFINTKAYKKEQKEGKVIYANKPVSWEAGWAGQYIQTNKNTANQGILHWGKRLYVFWGRGLPWKIDPKNLETFFQDDVRLQLNEVKSGGEPFGPRPVYDAAKNRMIIASYSGAGKIAIREFNDKFLCLDPAQQTLPNGVSASILPELGLTQRYYVLSVPSIKVDQLGLITGFKTLDQAVSQDVSQGSTLLLIPRVGTKGAAGGGQAIAITVDAHICAGVANAYDDDATGDVIIDLIRSEPLSMGKAQSDMSSKGTVWDQLDYRTQVPKRELVRYRVDPASKTVVSDGNGGGVDSGGGGVGSGNAAGRAPLCSHHSHDRAIVNPLFSAKPHRYVWLAVGKHTSAPSPIQGVMRVDTASASGVKEDAWFPEPYEFLGALSFAPRKTGQKEGGAAAVPAKEDDGYLIGTLLNGKDLTSQVVIFDASSLAKGPICRLGLKTNIPPSNHAYFAAGVAWAPDVIDKSFALVGLFSRKGWNGVKSDFSGLGIANLLDDLESIQKK